MGGCNSGKWHFNSLHSSYKRWWQNLQVHLDRVDSSLPLEDIWFSGITLYLGGSCSWHWQTGTCFPIYLWTISLTRKPPGALRTHSPIAQYENKSSWRSFRCFGSARGIKPYTLGICVWSSEVCFTRNRYCWAQDCLTWNFPHLLTAIHLQTCWTEQRNSCACWKIYTALDAGKGSLISMQSSASTVRIAHTERERRRCTSLDFVIFKEEGGRDLIQVTGGGGDMESHRKEWVGGEYWPWVWIRSSFEVVLWNWYHQLLSTSVGLYLFEVGARTHVCFCGRCGNFWKVVCSVVEVKTRKSCYSKFLRFVLYKSLVWRGHFRAVYCAKRLFRSQRSSALCRYGKGVGGASSVLYNVIRFVNFFCNKIIFVITFFCKK